MKQKLLFVFICFSTIQLFAQPANDDPCGAINLSVASSCSLTATTNAAATNSAGIPAPGCASYNGQDVWYRLTVPANGSVQINTYANSMTDSGMAIYTSLLCSGPFTLVECDDDDGVGTMSSITRTGLTPLSTLWIRVWDYGGGTGTFSICAMSVGPCGTPLNNDYCPNPAQLTQGPGNFSATTDVTFTQDQPGNLTSIFCGSIENNSWYQFTASATSHSFPITSVTGCVSNFGIQAQVYSVTYSGLGCCTGFASVSNCYNPGNLTLGTVTATGLTVGNQYLLMIDGNAGDGCEFTISGWTATGILPVELSEFSGVSEDYGNVLKWTTESEHNNDYFDVLYSRDANTFEKIGTIQGAGTTTQQQDYSFVHQGVQGGTNFYQLAQVDTDGGITKSKIISINSKVSDGLFSVYPNPVSDELTLQFQSSKEELVNVSIYDQKGALIETEDIVLGKGFTSRFKDLSELKAGVYTLVVTSTKSTVKERIVKTN